MVGIINYGAGNVFSVYSAVNICGYEAFMINDYREVKKADIIIIPGVGSFDDGMQFLLQSGIGEEIKNNIEKGKLFLGICLGLQFLFEKSEEGNLRGFNIFKGEVKKFTFSDKSIKVPHMGWSKVIYVKKDNIFSGIPDGSYFYFAHSYYADVKNDTVVYGITNYGINFTSVVKKDNIVGVQFHPEKSGKTGLTFLKNFLKSR